MVCSPRLVVPQYLDVRQYLAARPRSVAFPCLDVLRDETRWVARHWVDTMAGLLGDSLTGTD